MKYHVWASQLRHSIHQHQTKHSASPRHNILHAGLLQGDTHSYHFHRTSTCLFTVLESGQPPALPDTVAARLRLCCLSSATENHFGLFLHHLLLMLTLTLWFTLYPEIPCSASKYNTTQLSTDNPMTS